MTFSTILTTTTHLYLNKYKLSIEAKHKQKIRKGSDRQKDTDIGNQTILIIVQL